LHDRLKLIENGRGVKASQGQHHLSSFDEDIRVHRYRRFRQLPLRRKFLLQLFGFAMDQQRYGVLTAHRLICREARRLAFARGRDLVDALRVGLRSDLAATADRIGPCISTQHDVYRSGNGGRHRLTVEIQGTPGRHGNGITPCLVGFVDMTRGAYSLGRVRMCRHDGLLSSL
jgi:hypothetical protein